MHRELLFAVGWLMSTMKLIGTYVKDYTLKRENERPSMTVNIPNFDKLNSIQTANINTSAKRTNKISQGKNFSKILSYRDIF